MRWQVHGSPIGDLGVALDDAGVCGIRFGGPGGRVEEALRDDPRFVEVARELDAYFAGTLTDFDLPLSVRSGTPFERAVWQAIAHIPYGEMNTYGRIAAEVGEPDAARAVGVACNRNPLPVVVACHRVVGAGGKMVGFGGGLPRKRFLLELEARVRVERTFLAG